MFKEMILLTSGELIQGLFAVQARYAGPVHPAVMAHELYSDELLEYMNKHMRMMPVLDYMQGVFSFADFFNVDGWDRTVAYVWPRPCVLVGRSKPLDSKSNNDVQYESFIGTFMDDVGCVFNLEVRQYCFKVRGEFVNVVTRQFCQDQTMRLDVVEEFFPETYRGLWDEL